MKHYIAFLRGVMPTGKNKVPMAELREVLTASRLFSDVRTYIQSGNVLLGSVLSPSRIEQVIHDEIAKKFGGDISVVVRTGEEVREVLKWNPFKSADTARVFFTLLKSSPDQRNIKELKSLHFYPDEFSVGKGVVYLHCPVAYGKSKLSNNFIEKKLGVSATTRNYRTMTKLLELTLGA